VIEVVEKDNVGNVALVLIESGEVYEELFRAVEQKVDSDTVFAAASMSKWITALGIMNLVQSGRIDLDEPVSTYLSRWHLPDGEFNQSKVTVRLLLSHMSGLTDGLGFGDYEPDEVLPSLESSLKHPRASSGDDVQITLGRPPGSEWDYSGGGYLILQLVVEEVTGISFEGYMQNALFEPLSMSRSSFRYIEEFENRSISYDKNGQPAVSYQYAASAATGFSSSITDMTRLVKALVLNAPGPIEADVIEQMRKPQASLFGFDIWGLGTILYAATDSSDFVYGHDGQNDPAINSAVRINPDNGDAIVVFASGNPSLATRLGFEWVIWQTGRPDFLGFGYLIDRGLQIALYGSIVIVLMSLVIAWWSRRKRLSL
jgi:CubicO group peptidase (beta-lactamase class C family)